VRAAGRWLSAGRSGKVSPHSVRALRTYRSTRVYPSRAIKYTQPSAAIRVGVSRKIGVMAAGFLAHLKLSSAAGCLYRSVAARHQ
jgi:hypothetical protein